MHVGNKTVPTNVSGVRVLLTRLIDDRLRSNVAGTDRIPARVDTSRVFWPPQDQGTAVHVFFLLFYRHRVFLFPRAVLGRLTVRAFR